MYHKYIIIINKNKLYVCIDVLLHPQFLRACITGL